MPASQALLTLAALAHPAWEVRPTTFDLAYAFVHALQADLVRARLLAEIVYRPRDVQLSTFDEILPDGPTHFGRLELVVHPAQRGELGVGA